MFCGGGGNRLKVWMANYTYPSLSRLIQKKNSESLVMLRGFVYGYLKNILLKKNILKYISSDNSAENLFLGRFQPWLWRITVSSRKFFSSQIFYILSWTILRLSEKENPDLSQNWPQEKLSKLTGRKSVLLRNRLLCIK